MRPGERRTARFRAVRGRVRLSSLRPCAGVRPSSLRPCAGGGIGLAISVIAPAGGMTTRSRGGSGGLRHDRGEAAPRRRGLSPTKRAGIPAAFAGHPSGAGAPARRRYAHLAGLDRAFRAKMAGPGTAGKLYGERGSSEEIRPELLASRLPTGLASQAGT